MNTELGPQMPPNPLNASSVRDGTPKGVQIPTATNEVRSLPNRLGFRDRVLGLFPWRENTSTVLISVRG